LWGALASKILNPWLGLLASFGFLALLLIPAARFDGKFTDWLKGFSVIFFVSWGIWIVSNYSRLVKLIGSAEVGYIIALLAGFSHYKCLTNTELAKKHVQS
jgi:hypothetical protein